MSEVVVDWPAALRPLDMTVPWLDHASTTGGRSFGGAERVIVRDPRWRWSVSFRTRNSAELQIARATLYRISGRANRIIMPICDCGRTPGATGFRYSPLAGVPHSDGAPFSDASLYRSEVYTGWMAAAAAVRATVLRVRPDYEPERIVSGQYITIHARLYAVTDVIADGADVLITITPPLRAAVGPDEAVRFDRPAGSWRLASDDTAKIALEALRFGTFSLELDEWL